MTQQLYDPWAHAEDLGIRVGYHPLKNIKGAWVPDQNLIVLRHGMRPFIERAVLAHEVAHAERNDPPGHHPSSERRANLTAALKLIDPDEWVTLTTIHTDYDRICIELGITREMFLEYHYHTRRETTWEGKASSLAPMVTLGEPRTGQAPTWPSQITGVTTARQLSSRALGEPLPTLSAT